MSIADTFPCYQCDFLDVEVNWEAVEQEMLIDQFFEVGPVVVVVVGHLFVETVVALP